MDDAPVEGVVVAVAAPVQGVQRQQPPPPELSTSARREMQGLFEDEVASDSSASDQEAEAERLRQQRTKRKQQRRRRRQQKVREHKAETEEDELLEEEGQWAGQREGCRRDKHPDTDGRRKQKGHRRDRPASAPGDSPEGRRWRQSRASGSTKHQSSRQRPASASVERQLAPFEIPDVEWAPLESGPGTLPSLPEKRKLRPSNDHRLGSAQRKSSATRAQELGHRAGKDGSQERSHQRGHSIAWDSESGADAETSGAAKRPSSTARARPPASRRPATAEPTSGRKVRPSSGTSVKSSRSARSSRSRRHKQDGENGGKEPVPFRPPSAPKATQRPAHLVGTPPNYGQEYIKLARPDSGRVREQRRREDEYANGGRQRSSERRHREKEHVTPIGGRAHYGGREQQKVLSTQFEDVEEDEEQGVCRAEKSRPGSAVSRGVQMAVALRDHPVDTEETSWWRKMMPYQKTRVLQEMDVHSPSAAKEARKALSKKARDGSVEVWVSENQIPLVNFLSRKDHLSLRKELPGTFKKIQRAVGPRKATKRCLVCAWVLFLVLAAISISLKVRLVGSESALQAANAVDHQAWATAAASAGLQAWATRSNAYRMQRTPAIPFTKFARVCRCFTREAAPLPMHVTRFEAVVDHIYSTLPDSPGFSQITPETIPLLAGMTLYEVSAPWSPPDRAPTGSNPSPPWPPGGTTEGSYCNGAGRGVNHVCPDGLGSAHGSTAKLLWQWSPDRNGGATEFPLPEAAGMRLEPGRPYSFVLQSDYDMRYFFGENSAGRVGAGQVEWSQWQPWDESGIVMHETSLLRPYDATVLSLTQLDFALGSNSMMAATTADGEATVLPRLARTEAIYSLDAEHGGGVLTPGGKAMVFAVAAKTRDLGTAAEVAVWRKGVTSSSPPPPPPPPGSSGDTSHLRTRVARWYQSLGVMWEARPYSPYVNSLLDPSSASTSSTTSSGSDAFGRYLTENDVLRLRCEFSVRAAGVQGGFGAQDEICGASLWVYPAQQVIKRDLYPSTATARAMAAASLPSGLGGDSETWLTGTGDYSCSQCFGR